MAHAELAGIDTAAAAAAPGVVAVFTAADLHLPAHHGLFTVNPQVPRPPLATDRVRFVGEAVAVVVAESAAAAADAADLVEVDYTPLPAAVDVEGAVARRAAAVPRPGLERGRRPARPRTGPTRWTARTSSSGRAWSTSGSRWCRWRATPSRSAPGSDRSGSARPHHLGLHPDAARLPHPGRRAVRPARGAGAGRRPARRRRVRRQGRCARRAHRRDRGRPRSGPTDALGRHPLGEPRVDAARARPGGLVRAGPAARRPHHRPAGPRAGRRRRLRRFRRCPGPGPHLT